MGSFGFFVNENADDQMYARWLICWNNLGEGAFAEKGGGGFVSMTVTFHTKLL